jgi:phage shock protein PspC (stress-responsive transcriptional regulator)
VIGGVAGGLGRYFNVDPLIFRIGFAVTAFFGGLGAFAYLGALLFVPEEGAPEGKRPSGAAIAGAAAVVALLLLFQVPFFGPWWIFDPGAWFGLAFLGALGIAVFLLVRTGMERGPVTPWRLIAYLVLAAFAICVAGCLAFLSAWAGAEGLGEIVAGTVLALGVVLVVGAFLGMRWTRWLVVPAFVLAAPLGAVAAADIEFEGGYGDRYHRPASVAAIPADGYELAAGELYVDLRDLDWRRGQVVDVELDLGAGEAIVLVPEEVCVETDAHATGGVIDVRGNTTEGLDIDHDERHAPGRAPRLRLEADLAFGELRVEDATFGDPQADDDDHDHRGFDGFGEDDEDDAERAAAKRACEAA